MSSSFFINGKEYIPSNVLCASFGYSGDYVAKLARDEKILGTQVGRQWFVEPSSLRAYLQKIAVEKEIQKEELSFVRKRERALNTKHAVTALRARDTKSNFEALAQSFAIMLCGIFVGGLSWISVQGGIGTRDIVAGTRLTVQQVATAVYPSVFPVASVDLPVLTASISNSVSEETTVVGEESLQVFTSLPTFPKRDAGVDVETKKLALTVAPQTASSHFSDEVVMTVNEEGQQLIEPVFKNAGELGAKFIVQEVTSLEQ